MEQLLWQNYSCLELFTHVNHIKIMINISWNQAPGMVQSDIQLLESQREAVGF